ncbi:MAG TPA: DUF2914 domain-containing protein [Geobacteraceae bacterium]|nr:DUF2914 domain-containing protein [Geobacteraceae bacterium]
MRRFSLLFLFVFVLVCFSSMSSSAKGTALKVTEMTVTTKIFRGEPVDSVKRLSSSSLKGLYCFTRVESSSEEETCLKHIWYYNGEMVGAHTLPVKGEQWRTYSKKLIEKGSKGPWRVEAIDGNGNLLKTVEFRMN